MERRKGRCHRKDWWQRDSGIGRCSAHEAQGAVERSGIEFHRAVVGVNENFQSPGGGADDLQHFGLDHWRCSGYADRHQKPREDPAAESGHGLMGVHGG